MDGYNTTLLIMTLHIAEASYRNQVIWHWQQIRLYNGTMVKAETCCVGLKTDSSRINTENIWPTMYIIGCSLVQHWFLSGQVLTKTRNYYSGFPPQFVYNLVGNCNYSWECSERVNNACLLPTACFNRLKILKILIHDLDQFFAIVKCVCFQQKVVTAAIKFLCVWICKPIINLSRQSIQDLLHIEKMFIKNMVDLNEIHWVIVSYI